MLEYIYVCRHGFRSNFIDPSITTGPTMMPRDPPLAAYGHEQAEQLAAFLSSSTALAPHPIPQKVFSSPFYRCIETSVPTAKSLGMVKGDKGEADKAYEEIRLEHGVQEWYSPVNPNTGLHPRPGNPPDLAPFFPDMINQDYTSTVYASREGELLKGIQDRADLFAEAWPARIEAEMPEVKSAVVFSHAATVIALGRAFTGNKDLEVPAGTCSCSLYRRKSSSTSVEAKDQTCGVGEWEAVWLGRTDFMPRGEERNWDFSRAAVYQGEVVTDDGDRRPHPERDNIPTGLASGMDKYLRRGMPPKNETTKELKDIAAELEELEARKGRL